MLSTPEFPAFAAKVVPFLHVTTRMDDRPHEKLLQEKGFGGFPSLAFMDAQGNVVAQPQDRTVAALDKTLAAIGIRADLKARIEAGEEGLAVELLLVEEALGAVSKADFATRAAACAGLTEEQQAQVDQILLDHAVEELAAGARRGDEAFAEAAAEFKSMLEAGTMPSADSRALGAFWSTLGRSASKDLDAALARRVAEGIRQDMADNEFQIQYADRLEQSAAQMDELATLKARVEEGEEGLAPDILALEYDLDAIAGEPFIEKAEALLEAATDAQKEALQGRVRETRFKKFLFVSRDPAVRAVAMAELLELLGEDGKPPESLAGNIWQLLLGHGRQTSDPDLMQRALDGLISVYGNREGFADFAKGIATEIQTLRDANAAKAAEAAQQKADEGDDGGEEDGDEPEGDD